MSATYDFTLSAIGSFIPAVSTACPFICSAVVWMLLKSTDPQSHEKNLLLAGYG